MRSATTYVPVLLLAVALAPQSARADEYDNAWACAKEVGKGVKLAVVTGGKALRFTVENPQCIARMGAPATAVPLAVVVTMGNAGIMSTTQPDCYNDVTGVAIKPLADGLSGALSGLGLLHPSDVDTLAQIAAGQANAAMLDSIPGLGMVTGSLTCGCELLDAGLTIDTIKEVINTADNIGEQCGGEVWRKAREIVDDAGEFAGDAVDAAVSQVSNLGDAISGQSKHVPLQVYFDQNWKPNIEHFASVEFKAPGSWHNGEKWDELWGPCVDYFDVHTMSRKNSRDTCDDMRSGTTQENGLFAGNGFQQRMFARVFQFDVTGAVAAAREQAYIDYAGLEPSFTLPQELADDSNAIAQIAASADENRPAMVKAAIDEVYGTPKREKMHDGQVVSNSAPATIWPQDTVGARALAMYDQVRVGAGDARADAAQAVQLAIAEFDLEQQLRLSAGVRMLDFYQSKYQGIKMGRDLARDQAQEKIDGYIEQCPTQECKDALAMQWRTCSVSVVAFREENAAALANFDSPAARQATAEVNARQAACMAEARQTLRNAMYVSQDETSPGQGTVSGGRTSTGMGPNVPKPLGESLPRETTVEAPENLEGTASGEVRPVRQRYSTHGLDPRLGAGSVTRLGRANAETPQPGSNFPGCAAVRGAMQPRVYGCATEEAYRQCLETVGDDTSIQCVDNSGQGAPAIRRR